MENKMNQLIEQVTQKTGLSQEKAQTVVELVVNYIDSKLPAPLAGQIDDALKGEGQSITDKVKGAFREIGLRETEDENA